MAKFPGIFTRHLLKIKMYKLTIKKIIFKTKVEVLLRRWGKCNFSAPLRTSRNPSHHSQDRCGVTSVQRAEGSLTGGLGPGNTLSFCPIHGD